jgi:hypothetical protein
VGAGLLEAPKGRYKATPDVGSLILTIPVYMRFAKFITACRLLVTTPAERPVLASFVPYRIGFSKDFCCCFLYVLSLLPEAG